MRLRVVVAISLCPLLLLLLLVYWARKPRSFTSEDTSERITYLSLGVSSLAEPASVVSTTTTQNERSEAISRNSTTAGLLGCPQDSLAGRRIPFVDRPTNLSGSSKCLSGSDLQCGERAGHCLSQLVCADERADSQLLDDLLFRARSIAARIASNGGVNRTVLATMAVSDNARGTVIRVAPPNVEVVGEMHDVARGTAVLRRLAQAVRRRPELFPQLPTLLVLDTGDFPTPDLPLFSIYSAPYGREGFPSANFVLPDDTFSEGIEFDNRPWPKMVVEPFPLLYTNWTKVASLESEANFSSNFIGRKLKAYFNGGRSHRSRSWLLKVVGGSQYANVAVGTISGKAKNSLQAKHPRVMLEYEAAFLTRGVSASQRDKYCLAAGNAIIRLMDPLLEPAQFFHDLLRPYVHYIPVFYDHARKSQGAIKCIPLELEALFAASASQHRVVLARNNRHLAAFLANETNIDLYIAGLIGAYHSVLHGKAIAEETKIAAEVSELRLRKWKEAGIRHTMTIRGENFSDIGRHWLYGGNNPALGV